MRNSPVRVTLVVQTLSGKPVTIRSSTYDQPVDKFLIFIRINSAISGNRSQMTTFSRIGVPENFRSALSAAILKR
ncbi:hypothetical protein TNCV_958641 [Trichonephila clavipes]|nr:hypothetical protein TNCV_958641 [Trichonephila clavipes]